MKVRLLAVSCTLLAALVSFPAAAVTGPPDAPEAARVVTLPDLGVAFASWDAPGPAGIEHRVALSKDGGATWAPSDAMSYAIPLRAGRLVPGVTAPSVPENLRSRPGDRLFIVQLETKGLPELRRAVESAGARLLWYLPDHAWIARMDPARVAAVLSLPFVRWVGPYEPAYKIDPEILAEVTTRNASLPPERYHLETFARGPEEKALLARDVRAAGGEVVEAIPHGFILDAMLTLDQIVAIARSEHLAWLDRWSPPGNDMDLVRQQDGADYVESVAGYSGQGVRGEVMDCGIMAAHPDHDGRIDHGPAPSVCDHGTCTYGIVFGNGDRDGDGEAKATGNLPSAQGIFADYDTVSDRYQETAELLQSPYFAVFQSNSWGNSPTTQYNSISQQMDDIIWQDDITIFQSQSNNGNQSSRPQAWAKNIVSVGGIRHYDTLTLSDDCWCNGASIGPAADGRIKPDLAFWYDDIYTTDLDPGGYSAGLYTPTFGGTSAATPIVAGVSGLFYQMWADDVLGNHPQGTTVFEKRPHAMTMKALLINTADQYAFTGTSSDLTRTHQGWGLPSAKNLYDRRASIRVVDQEHPLQALDVHAYTAQVPAGQDALRVTMAYMDLPGTTSSSVHRINDVSIKVTDPSGSTVYYGNVGLDAGTWSTPGGAPNHVDTVENVFVQNPASGAWTIEVSADDVNQDENLATPEVDQDYALVVSGVTDLTFGCVVPPQPPSDLVATPNGDNRIDLVWTGTAASRGYKVYRAEAGCGGTMTFLASVPSTETTYSDTTASGGIDYAYTVRSVEACESDPTACADAIAQGPCILAPAFGGIASAASDDAAGCGITVSWNAGTASCGGPLVYNVYRSTVPGFAPSAANRVASCVAGTSLDDVRDLVANTTYTYIVRAEDLGGRGGATCDGAVESNLVSMSAKVQGPQSVLLDDDFESGPQGWAFTLGSPPATAGDWVAGTPAPSTSGGQPAQPGACASGAQCLYTGVNKGANPKNGDVDGGEVVATSPAFDAASFATARLTLSRWYFNDESLNDSADHFAVDVSSDGGASWVALESLGPLQSANAWTPVAFDLETRTALTAQMLVRVRAADGPNFDSIVEAAVDDVRVQGALACSGQAAGAPGDSGNASLRVGKDGANIRLTWGADCGGGTGYGIYRGDLSVGYASAAPVPGFCGVGGTSATIEAGEGSYFFLIAPNDGSVEGSLGNLSGGAPRPQPAATCWPRAAAVNACAG